MKKTLLFLAALLILGSGYGQKIKKFIPVGPAGIEQGDIFANPSNPVGRIVAGDPNTDLLQTWALPTDNSYSTNTRAPGNTFRWQRTEYLITAAEMAAAGFPANVTIDGIGFLNYTAGTTSQTGNFKVYLMNTTSTTYGLGTTWTTAGFTLVSSIASWTVPITVGPYTVNFSGGTPFTYTGGGLYIAWEFTNPSPGVLGTTAINAYCNTALVGGLVGGRLNTGLPPPMFVSNFRPATILFNNSITDILSVTNIYTTEQIPVPFGTPTPISVRVSNVSSSAATFDLTVNVTANPPYTSTQTGLTVAANSSVIVVFPGWSPTTLENVNITATATTAGENWTGNNTKTISAGVNDNLFSYCFQNVLQAAYGFTYPGSGIWANKYHLNGHGKVTGSNIYIYSSSTPANSGIGNTVSAVVLNSAGSIIAQSADLVLTSGNVNMLNNFTFATPPELLDEDFYVGLVQPEGTAQWYPMGCMTEAPVRPGTFFFFDIAGGTPQPSPLDVKFMVEAQVAAVPPPVPTLSEWGLILLGLALLGFGTFYILKMKSA